MSSTRALLLDLPEAVCRQVGSICRGSGLELVDREENKTSISEPLDLILAPGAGPNALTGERIREWKGLPGAPEVVALVEEELAPERATLLGAGCMAVLNWTVPDRQLAAAMRSIVERRREQVALRRQSALSGGPLPRLDPASTRSEAMRKTLILAQRVAASDATVLLLGETGVGKEWIARAIHEEGSRRGGPFVAINCAAVPESLLESELFGHERGAFTGAIRERRGVFEQSHGGTLFLDEIAEMTPHLQSKLLRVLQDRTIQRVGSERSFKVDVRLLAATSRALSDAIEKGTFRQDLYYRLAVMLLEIPPLRERREDIAELASRFVEHVRARTGSPAEGLDPRVLPALMEYSWPGNVRELLNAVERWMLLADGPMIGVADLGLGVGPSASLLEEASSRSDEWYARPLAQVRRDAIEEVEREYLALLLKRAGGRVGRAAELAELDPRSLYELMRRYGIRKEDFKPRRSSEA